MTSEKHNAESTTCAKNSSKCQTFCTKDFCPHDCSCPQPERAKVKGEEDNIPKGWKKAIVGKPVTAIIGDACEMKNIGNKPTSFFHNRRWSAQEQYDSLVYAVNYLLRQQHIEWLEAEIAMVRSLIEKPFEPAFGHGSEEELGFQRGLTAEGRLRNIKVEEFILSLHEEVAELRKES